MSVEVLTDSPLWHVHDDDEIVHLCCCVDESKILCGAINVDEFVGQDEAATCGTCIELEWKRFCPAGFICGSQAS